MILVGPVQQVVGGDVEFGHLLAVNLYVGTRRDVQQRIAGGGSLCFVCTIDVALTKETLNAGREDCIVE